MDRGSRRAISLSEAQQLIAKHCKPLRIQRVTLLESIGLRLAEQIVSEGPMPAFARSGMDGYAVRASDLAGASFDKPVLLAITQTVASGGKNPPLPLAQGEAARIMTGAPLPEGADTVVMLEAVQVERRAEEETETDMETVSRRWLAAFVRPEIPGRNVTAVGAEIGPGETLMEKGTRIGAGEVALLAAFGRTHPLVYTPPRVAIVTTGNEVIMPEELPGYGQIRNSNLSMLVALIRDAGATVVHTEHVHDHEKQMEHALSRGLAEADLVITSGGVSVGDFDVIGQLFRKPGRELLFNKLSMRPASVTSAALQEGKLLLGLSGNPGACFVGFELLGRLALARMGGALDWKLTSVTAYLGENFDKSGAFTRYVRGRTKVEQGRIQVTPCSRNRSSDMVSIKKADCLIVIPPCPSGLSAGTLVEVLPLTGRGIGS